jgi:DNA-binding IclR family transcriptional regulator
MSTRFAIRNSRVQSLDRALEMLEALAENGGELGATELARRLEVHRSTAFRLLGTLEGHGLVEQNPASEKFRLGYGLVRLAGAVVADFDLTRAARPVLNELARQTGETVNLAVLQGDQVVNIEQVASPHLVANVNWVGRQTPLHATSNGKILLAHIPSEQRGRLLKGQLKRFTPRTITDAAVLEKQLRRAVEEGYAFTLEELEVGLNAVAAPVRDAEGSVIAAVSVAGPSYRVTPHRLSELGEMTRDAADAVSRRMGYRRKNGAANSGREAQA